MAPGSMWSWRRWPERAYRNHPEVPQRSHHHEGSAGWQSVSPEVVGFLARLVRAGYNIFISGGTGSGKTTFLNALSQYIPKDERIITIEDNAELRILTFPTW